MYADDFETIVRVDGYAEASPPIDHAARPADSSSRFEPARTRAYFRIDKGTGHRPHVKRAAKGMLYDGAGRPRSHGVAVGESESLGVITQYQPGFFNRDLVSGDIPGYLDQIVAGSGFANLTLLNLVMLAIGVVFIYIAIRKDYEPLLLVPIGFGILVGNIPLPVQLFNSLSVYMIDPVTHQYVFNSTGNSVLGIIYPFVTSGVFPPLIFLGIGAMTDFSTLLSNPKTILLGAAAQIGIFATFLGALLLGFTPTQAASIGIIGGADGPTAIFLSSKLAPRL